MVTGSTLRVGVSATVLDRSSPFERRDGIGVYTRALLDQYGRRDDVRSVRVVIGRRVEAHDGAHEPEQLLSIAAMAASTIGMSFPSTRRLASRIDVYHATDYLIPRLRRTPVCATLYDAIPLHHPEWANPRLRSAKNFLLRRTARTADHVIAISHAMVPELVEQYRIDPHRISVTPLGVDDRWFERETEAAIAAVQSRYGLKPGYLLFVGTLQPRKNIERIVEAFGRLPPNVRTERQLVIAGRAPRHANYLVEMLRAAHANGSVRWIGYVPSADLRPLYQGAATFVFPSLYEGFGLPVLEAFASGIPVVTSNTTSLPEVAGDAAQLVDPTDVDALAAAIERLLEDSALAARFRAAGLARARTFTWARCASETVAVLKSIA